MGIESAGEGWWGRGEGARHRGRLLEPKPELELNLLR